MAVHVVGNVGIDWCMRVPWLPRAGETLNASELTFDLGGKGALQAIAAHRTGAPVRFHAAVGRDDDAALVRTRLRDAGLPVAGLVVVDAPTDRSVIVVDADGENLIVSAVAASSAFRADGWGGPAAPGDTLLVQNNLAAEVTARVLAEAAARGLLTVWNVTPLGEGAAPDLSLAALVIVNRVEGEALTGAREPADILARFRSMGAREAVVTLGGDGAAILPAGADAPTFIAAPQVEARDTSGAGDVFCGVLAGLLDRGLDLVTCARAATAVASIAVTRPGTARSVPTMAEVDAAIAGFWLA